jgi:NAD-dependent deacetylase
MGVPDDYETASRWIESASHIVAFTGAGISVESGIPTFRGEDGLWSRYDPKILDIGFFMKNPAESWRGIREIFYEYMDAKASPNDAHRFLARLEANGTLDGIITQNIDNLHQEAGSVNVVEFHGTAKRIVCPSCTYETSSEKIDMSNLPPLCPKCGTPLKPDFVFFGEAIPPEAYSRSLKLLENCDLLIIVGTTGEVAPASYLPYEAAGVKSIEINIEESAYTENLSDIFLRERASVACRKISEKLRKRVI